MNLFIVRASSSLGGVGRQKTDKAQASKSALSLNNLDHYRVHYYLVNRVAFFAACRSSASSIRRSISSGTGPRNSPTSSDTC